MEPRAQQDDMAVDRNARPGLSRFHVGNPDFTEVGDVPEIETDRLAHEEFERHGVDAGAVGTGVAEEGGDGEGFDNVGGHRVD